MKTFLSFVTLAALWLPGLTAAPPAAARGTLDPARLARIPERMRAFVEKGTIAGAVTLVARRTQIAAIEAAGWQDLEAKKPMAKDTIFQIKSMTKPVTGVAIMILLEEGRLALSDPVEKHLPEFRGQMMIAERREDGSRVMKKPPRAITIRDLMTHTSGMPSGAGLPDAYTRPLSEAVAIFSQQPLEFAPGAAWLYSNTGLHTLGRIVEVLADMPFERFVEQRILQPLGMKDTTFFPQPAQYGRIAVPYELKDGKLRRAEEGMYAKDRRNPGPSGGLYSSAADMAAFYQMMLNGGTHNGKRILSPAAVAVMTANHTGSIQAGHGPGLGFGLTWNVVREPMGTLSLLSEGSYQHGGAFGTHGFVDPGRDLIGVFMIQRTAGGSSAERDAFIALAEAAVTD